MKSRAKAIGQNWLKLIGEKLKERVQEEERKNFPAMPGPSSRGGPGPILLHLGDIFIGTQ